MNSTRTRHIRIHLQAPGVAQSTAPGFLRKLAAATVGAIVLVGAFMVSVVVLAGVALAALVGGSWLLWRTRELRKRLREHAQARQQAEGHVIEGEVIRDPR